MSKKSFRNHGNELFGDLHRNQKKDMIYEINTYQNLESFDDRKLKVHDKKKDKTMKYINIFNHRLQNESENSDNEVLDCELNSVIEQYRSKVVTSPPARDIQEKEKDNLFKDT